MRLAIAAVAALGLILFLLPGEAAWAGPGGEIVELAFKTWWGRIIVLVLAVVLLPLILYVFVRQALGVRSTKKDLARLAEQWDYFAWPRIHSRVKAGMETLYGEWSTGKLEASAEFMTAPYHASQQDLLDRWAEEGKRNVTELRKIGKIRPLGVHVESEESMSVVPVLITVDLVDYLEDVSTGKILKGKKKVQDDHEVIWLMVHDDGEWLLHAIEDGADSLAYASAKNTTGTAFLSRAARDPARASHSAPFEPAADVATTEKKEPVVPVGDDEDGDRRPAQVDERTKDEA